MQHRLKNALVAATVAVAFALAVAGPAPRGVTIRILPALPGDDSSVAGAINDRGQIVGTSFGPGGYRPVLWQDGMVTELVGLEAAWAVNDHGQVVGRSLTRDDGISADAALWQRGTITHLESLPGSFFSVASAINNRGEIVGVSVSGSPEDYHYHAVTWLGGKILELAPLPGDDGAGASAITADGDIAGWSVSGTSDAFRFRPVVWRNGTIAELGLTADAAAGSLTAMNDRGRAAGTIEVTGLPHPGVWEDGAVAELGLLAGDTRGYTNAINDRGQIVGSSLHGVYESRAVLWNDRAITPLTMLPGDTRSGAIGINSRGQVVGYSGRHAVIWRLPPTRD